MSGLTVTTLRYAIVLDLDDRAAAAVREMAERVAGIGHRDISGASVAPHVTLAACSTLDVEGFQSLLAAVSVRTSPVATTFASLGVFPTGEGVIFLAPTVSRELLDLQLQVIKDLQDISAQIEPYWLPGQWVPHCTLAAGISPEVISTAMERALKTLRPINASLVRLSLVEINSPRRLYAFELKPG
jgi:2'-5' RNA ligase